ncbi:MAG: hypothetical protein H7178_07750 [Chitinophagaceae bacterium]|nr:hypothetical protein [Chitinophagaceae bacterium]
MIIIPSNQIDKIKWDACIANSSNGFIYAHSYYLDAMAKEWHGLIVNDYETVFPIAIKKKFGFPYCYMPAFTQQLGFVGNMNFDEDLAIKQIIDFVKYGSPYLNFNNQHFATKHQCFSRKNYVIDLSKPYYEIKNQYKKSTDYSLSKGTKLKLSYVADENVFEAVSLYQKHNHQYLKQVKNKDYENLQTLLTQLQRTKQVIIRKAVDANEQLLSIVLLLKDNKRLYNLINYTTEDGRKCEANYFLYDNILKEFSSKPMLFDFEGSDLPGVSAFYEKFGAINQPFFHWHFNHLPFPLKFFKQ